ncbi:MAG: thioredoxin domain-containing protein [Cytophagales bacterium]|nr:thioredoxin domain-containing protein [Bernardetiaceae bacterium]MDW8203965.1 thioredoxin domain-containing protein [Cytophagales bacterium]
MPFTNRLAQSSSPYLLQHAHNPVDWYPWGEEALDRARREDKPIILSIGYSACHWCHVMERECFENEAIAELMNRYYVCIKVDREERPDIDQIYMDALHAMGLNGGWPLNVFLTPDAKPFYGGTYFPPRTWKNLLRQVANAFANSREKINESAEQFNRVLNRREEKYYGLATIAQTTASTYTVAQADGMFEHLSKQFDLQDGGMNRAPKFPMPSIYLFLLRYWHISQNQAALQHVHLTLQKMARGGIYDQIGGGFARYSVDEKWLVPHFEKMLYDNAQLISLYAEAYTATRLPLYKQVVAETIDFVQRELLSPEGGFYAALDADSEGMEGRFYIWTDREIEQAFQLAGLSLQEAALCQEYYGCYPEGNWEHNYNILHCPIEDEKFCHTHHLSSEELQAKMQQWKKVLLAARALRVRPGLDDKILAGWNGLMVKGLSDAYAATTNRYYLQQATQTALFLHEKMTAGEQLYRSYKNGKADIPAYLEDYAAVIQGYLALYQVGGEERWLYCAAQLTRHVLQNFADEQGELLFFVDKQHATQLIARKKELFDNVIPASNSIMAQNLFILSLLLPQEQMWAEKAEKMLLAVMPLLQKDIRFMANWATLFLQYVTPPIEIAITGKQAEAFALAIHANAYFPHKVVAFSDKESLLPLLENRYFAGQTKIFVCRNKTCRAPVDSVEAAFEQIQSA